MKKETLIGIVALTLILGGVLFFANQQPPAPETPQTGDTVVITHTDDGYVPDEVTVRRGTTVRFLNEASRPSWPASAIHPTHSLYPQKSESDCLGSSFDACRGLETHEYYDFTFDEIGEWSFHDHLRASHNGVVIVE